MPPRPKHPDAKAEAQYHELVALFSREFVKAGVREGEELQYMMSYVEYLWMVCLISECEDCPEYRSMALMCLMAHALFEEPRDGRAAPPSRCVYLQ